MAKCLRCGAGSEWIQGRVAPDVDDSLARTVERLRELLIPKLERQVAKGSGYATVTLPMSVAREIIELLKGAK